MSVKAVAWVLDDLQGLKPGPTLVMLALADFADERNSCFPGQERIAGRARCSKRSVINYLRELQELGLISVETRTYSQGRGAIRRSSNRYILHVGKTYGLECAQTALSNKKQGQNDNADSAPSTFESAETSLSKVQPVAPKEPPVKEPPVPPTPEGGRAAQLPGAAPAGAAGQGSVSATGKRFAQISLALIGQADMPSDVTAEELAAARDQMRQLVSDDDRSLNGLSEPDGRTSSGRVITPLEEAPEDELVNLARSVLPGPMQAMGPAHLAKAGRAVADRIEAGWAPEQITAVLESRELPRHVRNLVALVLARLRDDIPTNQPPPRVDAEPAAWSHVLSDGRVVTRRDLDAGALARDFHLAVKEGTWQSGDRWAFAVAAGVERYLISR